MLSEAGDEWIHLETSEMERRDRCEQIEHLEQRERPV